MNIVDKKISNERPLPQWETGTVKWFDRQRRFGFIYFDDVGDSDQAFLPWTVVQESNISERALKPEVRVRFTWKASRLVGGNPEVTRIVLVDRWR